MQLRFIIAVVLVLALVTVAFAASSDDEGQAEKAYGTYNPYAYAVFTIFAAIAIWFVFRGVQRE